MSLQADGTGKCDRCGQIEEAVTIALFVIVSDLEETNSVTRHYCRRNQCSNAIRDAGTGPPPSPQTDDKGTPSNQTSSDGTLPPPPPPAPDPSPITPASDEPYTPPAEEQSSDTAS